LPDLAPPVSLPRCSGPTIRDAPRERQARNIRCAAACQVGCIQCELSRTSAHGFNSPTMHYFESPISQVELTTGAK